MRPITGGTHLMWYRLKWYYGGCTMEAVLWRWCYSGGTVEVVLWRWYYRGGTMEVVLLMWVLTEVGQLRMCRQGIPFGAAPVGAAGGRGTH